MADGAIPGAGDRDPAPRPQATRRQESLARAGREVFDCVVVGGGITGAGVALDAAARGLSVLLLERDDFASGTSSKSSKLIHGGLRYLQQGDVRLVYQALRERRRLMRNAPHLVSVLPFMIPVLTRDGVVSRKIARALGSAMWMYDLTGGWRIGRVHRRISADAAIAHLPTMRSERLSSAYLYYDAEADDARLCLSVVRTAVDRGAVALNRCAVVSLSGPDADGVRTVAVRPGDPADPQGLVEVRCRSVVNAAGVWSDEVRALDDGALGRSMRPAKGVHLTVPWDKVRNDIAVVIPVPRDKRSLFVVPWGPRGDGTFDHTYVGTTDTSYDGPIDDPQCTKDDIDYVLGALSAAITTSVTADDVTAVWSGLRPLVAPEPGAQISARTADLSRRHRVNLSESGVVTVTGGKLTTYREMARDTVEAVLTVLARTGGSAPRYRRRRRLPGLRSDPTARLALRGAVPRRRLDAADEHSRHLLARYGSDAAAITALVEAHGELARPMVPGLPYLMAEAVHAVQSEMALGLDDILSRRTRARLRDRRATMAAAPAVARAVAPWAGWDEARCVAEVASFVASCADEEAAARVTEAEYVATTAAPGSRA